MAWNYPKSAPNIPGETADSANPRLAPRARISNAWLDSSMLRDTSLRMPQENVEVVIKQFEDTNARDFVAVMDAYADDVTLIPHGDLGPAEHPVTGKAAVGEWFGDWFR